MRNIRAGRAFVELYVKRSAFMRGLAGAQARLRAFGQSAQAMGRQMVMMSAIAAAPIVMATRTFASFDDQMKTVQAVTGATTEKFGELYEMAKRLGRTTSYTASEVGGGMVSLGRAGFRPEEIKAATADMLNLARATGTELAEASDIAAGTLRAFQLEAGQMGRVADVMTATANNSAQTLTDLGEAMKYIAPLANEAGESVEDTAKIIGILANMQIKGSMAGTGYRQMLLQLADPAKRAKLAAMGIATANDQGDMRATADIVRDMAAAMTEMGSAERLAFAKEYFGSRAATSAVILGKAIDSYGNLSNAIDHAGGTAQKTADLMDSGLGGSLRILWSAVEGVQIAIGEALSEAFSNLADAAAPMLNMLAEFIKENKELVVRVVAAIAGVATAGVALMTFGAAVQIAGFALGGLHAAVMTVIGVTSTAMAIFGAILSPIGLLTAGIMAAAGAFIYFSGLGGKLLEWLGSVFGSLQDTFAAIGNAIKAGDIEAAVGVIVAGVKYHWIRLTTWLTETWQGFLIVWTDLTTGIALAFLTTIAGLKLMWVELVGYLTKLWEKWKSSTFQEGLAEALAPIFARIKGVSTEDVRKAIEEDYARSRKSLPGRVKAIDAATDAKKAQITEANQAAQAALYGERDRANAERAEKIAAASRELDAARKARDAALERARNAKATVGADGESKPTMPTLPGVPAIIQNTQAVKAKISSMGTFSASALSAMGGGGPVEKMADGIEDICKIADKDHETSLQVLGELKRMGFELGTS